jgi:hypothetical protein
MEMIDMRSSVVLLVAIVVMGFVAVGQTDDASTLFDREAFIAQVHVLFTPLEPLLPKGDSFDYERVRFFTGVLNGVNEHIINVPVTSDSVSIKNAAQLGQGLNWDDIPYITFCGICILPPNDCVVALAPGVPYLVRSKSWDQAEVVNSNGVIVRYFVTTWVRDSREGEWLKFAGANELFHMETCGTAPTDQR